MHRFLKYLFVVAVFLTIFGCFESTVAQDQVLSDSSPAAVSVKGQKIFVFYSLHEGKSPQERARALSIRLQRIIADHNFVPGLLRISDNPNGTDIMYGRDIIATVTIGDAKEHKSSTRRLASKLAGKLRNALVERKEEVTAGRVAYAISVTVISTLVLLIGSAIIFQMGSFTARKLEEWKGSKIKSIKIQNATLLSADMTANLISSVVQISQFIIFLIALYCYVLTVLEAFPNTTALGVTLREASIAPLGAALEHFLDYLPNLFAILILALITYGAIALARFFFDAVDAGTISFSGFDAEWAKPTYKLTRALILAFFLVLALPYFPGWESESFKQVGLLVGLLVSLGSTSVIGHIMAGTVLTYSKAFKVGDRIGIGSCTGDILEKSMFVTRIKTPKNEIISIPNAEILNSHIINYSKMAASGELILHTKITIGYDVPWRTVQKLLVDAALETESVLHEPAPFVLEKELADFSITYELNVYTKDATSMQIVYSELHRKIIDQFDKAGLEIMSPQFISLRDGNAFQVTQESPANKNPKPTFEVSYSDKGGGTAKSSSTSKKK